MRTEEAVTVLEEIFDVYDVIHEASNGDDGYKEMTALRMAIEALQAQEPRGVYQCFHCGSYSVIWGADFDFSDYGLEGEGVVHSCHCGNCGADIEYYVRIGDDD